MKLEKVLTDISNRSPLSNLLNVNDIIIEVQKTPFKSIADFKKLVNNIFKKGEKTLLLTIINQNNQRRYLGVKNKLILPKKIILLAGPTASGKSKLAIHLAKKLNGEIINADSMQIYKEFSILSSRPSKFEMRKIKHHIYGTISVKKHFSAGDWFKEAKKNRCLYSKEKNTNYCWWNWFIF